LIGLEALLFIVVVWFVLLSLCLYAAATFSDFLQGFSVLLSSAFNTVIALSLSVHCIDPLNHAHFRLFTFAAAWFFCLLFLHLT
jgi:hypothetical protein